MRILCHVPWVVDNRSIGGTEHFALKLCAQLREKGHDAFIVCPAEGESVVGNVPVLGRRPEMPKGDINEFFYRDQILKGDVRNPAYGDYVAQQIDGIAYDALILNSILCAGMDRDGIIVHHENPQELDNYWGPGSYERLKGAFRSSMRSVAESAHYADLYRKDLGMDCVTIPSGIDHTPLPDRSAMRAKHGIPEESLVFLVPCRLEHKQKGQDIVVRAFEQLELPDFRLIFSGNDPAYHESYAYISGMVKAAGLEERTIFGNYADMRELYALTDIALLPERFASFGFSLAQACAAGLPTVASAIPTFQEIAGSLPYVKLVQPEGFADAIRSTIGMPRHTAEGAAFAKSMSWERTATRYLDLLSNNF